MGCNFAAKFKKKITKNNETNSLQYENYSIGTQLLDP